MAQRKEDDRRNIKYLPDEDDSEMGSTIINNNKVASHIGVGVSESGSTVLKDPNVDMSIARE